MRHFYLLILAALALSCTKAQEADFAFTHVNLLTMESEAVLTNQTVLIQAGKIIAIGDAKMFQRQQPQK